MGGLGKSICLNGTLLKTFFWEFSKNFQKSSFSEHPLKMYEVSFLERLVASNNFITLIKWLYYRLFYGKLFHNTQRKHFSWGLFWLKSEVLGCRPAISVKKKIFASIFLEVKLFACCSFLVTFCSLLFTFYSLLDKKFWNIFFLVKVNKRFSILICTKSLICGSLEN